MCFAMLKCAYFWGKNMLNNGTTDLELNIRKYMNIKSIKYYSTLLMMIGAELGFRGEDRIEFMNKNKSNFSKMLKGERPLEKKFIEPLEKILGVSLAKLTCEYSYEITLSPEEIPFLKGFRFYAYKDDLKLYDELDKICDVDGDSILFNSDEFNKGFLDYLVEYQSINGIRFLYKKHNFICATFCGTLECLFYPSFNMFCNNTIEVAKLIAKSGDENLFNGVFNNFEFIARDRYMNSEKARYKNPTFIENVIRNKNIFESLFKVIEYDNNHFNIGCTPLNNENQKTNLINPLIEHCLDFTLMNITTFKNEAIKILTFAYKYNNDVISDLDSNYDGYHIESKYYVCERGGRLVANLILTDIKETGDKEIDDIIMNLPCIKKDY